MDIKINSSKETRNKFFACFGSSEEEFEKCELPSEAYFIDQGIKVEAFKKLMYKNDLEEYTNLFLFYLEEWKYQIEDIERKTKFHCENIVLEKTLTDALVYLLSNDKGEATSIIFNKQRGSKTFKGECIIESVIDGLIGLYDMHKFNKEQLTIEEAEEEITKGINSEWIENWIWKNTSEYPDYNHPCLDIKELDINSYINSEMIAEYAEDHRIVREVNLEFLKRKGEEIIVKKKAFAYSKSIAKVSSIIQLSYLKRLDKFLNQIEISDIDEYPLSNEDCRFIHDCLVCFKMIRDYSMNNINTTTPEKYIRGLMNQRRVEWDNDSDISMANYIINQLKIEKEVAPE